MDAVNGDSPFQRLVDHEDAAVVDDREGIFHLFVGKLLKFRQGQGVEPQFDAADGFHDALLKGSADTHDFARGFHLGAQSALGVNELVEGPFGELDD